MDWQDEGAVISVHPHGESAAIIEVFTAAHGRHAGVVRGGASRKLAPVLQPGGQVSLTWRARLADHLGVFTVEPVRARWPPFRQRQLSDFAKQIQPHNFNSSRPAPNSRRFISPSRSAMPAHDALAKIACSALSR